MADAGLIDIGSFVTAQLARRQPPRQQVSWGRRNQRMRAFAVACGAEVVEGSWAGPAFNYVDDVVLMPAASAYVFKRVFLLQATFFLELAHELVHFAQHPKRLARPRHREPGDDEYSRRRELEAEIGAVLLCFDLGLARHVGLPNAKYLRSWLSGLPNPQVELDVAFAAANQATAFLLARANSARGRAWTS